MSYQLVQLDGMLRAEHYSTDSTLKAFPAGIYSIKLTKEHVNFIVMGEEFKGLPKKMIGSPGDQEELMINAIRRKGRASAIAEGLKGSGKTTLMKRVCNWAILEKNAVVFYIEEKIPASALRVAIDIALGDTGDRTVLVLIDEIDRAFPKKSHELPDQQDLLPLLSDSMFKTVSFLATTNDLDSLSDAMVNRPGRFLYRFRYKDLDTEVFDHLLKKHRISGEAVMALKDWHESVNVSYDVLSSMLTAAEGSSSILELYKAVRWLNVPGSICLLHRPTELYVPEDATGTYSVTMYHQSHDPEKRYLARLYHNSELVQSTAISFDQATDEHSTIDVGYGCTVKLEPVREDKMPLTFDESALPMISSPAVRDVSSAKKSPIRDQIDEWVATINEGKTPRAIYEGIRDARVTVGRGRI